MPKGFGPHVEEIKIYIRNRHVDILHISETHFTTKSYIKIPSFTIYDTQNPDGTAHGGKLQLLLKLALNITYMNTTT
jgi:hypothetical protein